MIPGLERGVRTPRRPARTPISIRRSSSIRRCASGRCRACGSRVRSPDARAMSRARPSVSWRVLRGRGAARPARQPSRDDRIGALINHITGGHIETIDDGPRSFQPMNVNFGLFPPLERTPNANDGKRLRGAAKALAKRALTDRRAISARGSPAARSRRRPGRHGALDPRRVPADEMGASRGTRDRAARLPPRPSAHTLRHGGRSTV